MKKTKKKRIVSLEGGIHRGVVWSKTMGGE